MTASTQAPPDTSSRIVLAAGRVVTASGAELAPGWLEITCAKVAAVGAGRPASGGTEPVSGTIVPGFVDMHAHGALGHDFVSADDDGIHAIRRHHARRGTTTLMATVATAPIETMLERVRFLRPYVAAGLLAGIHLEGPYLAPERRGAHDPGLLRHPDGAEIRELLAEAAGTLRMVTLAPELPDLRDVRDRAVARLLGLEDPGVPEITESCVIVAHDLAPAETVGLRRDLVLAIVTESGGPTSHTAILAAQMGIPAVVQVPGAVAIGVGTVVAVDGSTGEVFVDPDPLTRAEVVQRRERRAKALGTAAGPGKTSDGHPVALLANIGTAEDAERAALLDVEGVGLFRTEFLFLDRDTAPSLEEQVAVYTRVFEAFGARRVVVRTLDAGADKPLAFANLGPEENPALGRRGLRLSAERPDLLDTQLSALAAAARATGADVRVMAPMVATAEEAAWFARRVHENGLPSVGVMIEVPSAALRARHVLAEVDFASIGTNDLAQYTLAADRMQGELATLLDPWQPAVLDLVAAACDGGRDTGTPIGVCGEAAADPLLALVLTGLGVSSLSMAPTRVSAVRAALFLHDLGSCTAMAAAARAARSPQDARDAELALTNKLITELV
jgi:phosphotransferase system enzyme I (PtsI)